MTQSLLKLARAHQIPRSIVQTLATNIVGHPNTKLYRLDDYRRIDLRIVHLKETYQLKKLIENEAPAKKKGQSCKACNKFQPFSKFRKDCTRQNGYETTCKTCQVVKEKFEQTHEYVVEAINNPMIQTISHTHQEVYAEIKECLDKLLGLSEDLERAKQVYGAFKTQAVSENTNRWYKHPVGKEVNRILKSYTRCRKVITKQAKLMQSKKTLKNLITWYNFNGTFGLKGLLEELPYKFDHGLKALECFKQEYYGATTNSNTLSKEFVNS